MATGGPAPGCARDRGRGDADVPPHRASPAPHAEPHTHRGAAQPTERPRGRRADPGWDIGHMWGARGTARTAPGAAQSPAGSGGAHPAQPRTTPCFWPLSAAGGSAAVCPMGAALPAPLQGSTCSAALGNPGGGMCSAGQGAAPLSASVAVCVPRAHRPHVPPQNCGPSAHPCGHSTATVRPFGTRRASGTARSTAAGGGRWRGGDGCSLGWRQRGRGATGTGAAGPGVQAEPWGLSRGTEPGARGWARGGGTAGRHPNHQRDAMGAMGMEEAGITPSTKSPRVQPQCDTCGHEWEP